MDDLLATFNEYITTFREAVYDAIAVYVNPHDYNRLIEGLGSDFTPSMDASTQTVDLFALMGGCAAHPNRANAAVSRSASAAFSA